MPEQDNLDRSWELKINLSGLVAPTGQKDIPLPEGYYAVKLTDLYINPTKNPNRVVIKMAIVDEPFTGIIRTTGMGVPRDANDKVRYYWRGLAESAGYTPADLDAGEISIGPAAFKGRDAFVRYTPAETEGGYEQIDFLAPNEWKQQKQLFAHAKPVDAAPASDTKPAKDTKAATGNKAEVLKKLGL